MKILIISLILGGATLYVLNAYDNELEYQSTKCDRLVDIFIKKTTYLEDKLAMCELAQSESLKLEDSPVLK